MYFPIKYTVGNNDIFNSRHVAIVLNEYLVNENAKSLLKSACVPSCIPRQKVREDLVYLSFLKDYARKNNSARAIARAAADFCVDATKFFFNRIAPNEYRVYLRYQ